MGSKVVSIASLVVVGVIIANIIIHPAGSQAAANGVATISKPPLNALLGQAS